MACTAGIAAFDYYNSGEFQSMLANNIKVFEEEAKKLQEQHNDMIAFVRNIGMSMGIGICHNTPDSTKEQDNDATFKVLYRCFEKGLIVISLAGNILRIQPPLVITTEQIRKAFSIINESINDYKSGKISDKVLKNRAGW